MSRVLFLSPHADDETLFGSFIIQQELPEVWVILDGHTQRSMGKTDAPSQVRRGETLVALWDSIGEERNIHFGGFSDINPDWEKVGHLLAGIQCQEFDKVYAPYPEPHESAHVQHNKLGFLAAEVFGQLETCKLIFYATYNRQNGKTGHVTPHSRQYYPTSGVQIARKHLALACYTSQMEVIDCREHFMRDLKEYVVDYRPGEMWWEQAK